MARAVESTDKKLTSPICGIVMPISAIDGCDEHHWVEVLNIISEVIKEAGYTPNIVSISEEVGVLHKNIVQNLYENPIIVCDISGKNPNVMFELGMRLAFDKPTVIIKDDKTSYSFDTSPIEHIIYPRDLRFTKILDFKSKLASKIKATAKASENDTNFSPFLAHFGSFKVAKIDTQEVSIENYILDAVKQLQVQVQSLSTRSVSENEPSNGRERAVLRVFISAEKPMIHADVVSICNDIFASLDIRRPPFKVNKISDDGREYRIIIIGTNMAPIDLTRVKNKIMSIGKSHNWPFVKFATDENHNDD